MMDNEFRAARNAFMDAAREAEKRAYARGDEDGGDWIGSVITLVSFADACCTTEEDFVDGVRNDRKRG